MKKYKWTIGAVAAIIAAMGYLLFVPATANAADLGGNCCADLEERIAELEATTATKGNRKTTVQVYGRVSQAVVFTDFGDYNDWSAGENSNAPSFLGVGGGYRVTPDVSVNYTLQIGLGGYEASGMGYGHLEGDTHGLYLRKASLSLESKSMGSLTIGKTRQATDGIAESDRSQSWMASRSLSLRPLTGPGVGEALELFDGTRANVVRYDSPTLAGFWVSGSIAAANTDAMGNTDGKVWDIAARYWNTVGDFDIAAGIGYREGISIEDDSLVGGPLSIAVDGTPKVASASGSVLHKPTGLFVNAAYGNMDLDPVDAKITGYSAKVGVEKSWWSGVSEGKGMGMASNNKTTAYLEYGKWDLSDFGGDDIDYYGVGVVQGLGPVSLYASGRQYDFGGEDATVIMAGMTANF